MSRVPHEHPLRTLQRHADERAQLLKAAQFESLDEATAPLFAYARKQGLVAQLGDAVVRAVIMDSFKTVIQ